MLREQTIRLARLRPGEAVLDVGCGTGTLALEAARCVGRSGAVAGIDPRPVQIARAQAKAARRDLPVDFQICAIEQLPFLEESFEVVLSTLMMHHLPHPLKQQGLTEIARAQIRRPSGHRRLHA
jgi:ubiquinone/menaquinone biosynthesis C-methylase UbiE